MCNFFSCISDGKGKVLFFTPEQVVLEMLKDNPQDLNFNSHTSIADFNGIKGEQEDKWNKWEYDPEKDVLSIHNKNTDDDSVKIQPKLKEFFDGKNISYLRSLYGRNSGHRNSGYMNSGDMNSGHMNSGHMNSGDMNSGDINGGHMNSGDMNSGDRNSGDMNSGHRNSGYMNSGDMNSGYMNSGDMNSGYCNSSNVLNGFCSKNIHRLFDKPCTESEFKKAQKVFSEIYQYISLADWIDEDDMTEKEKEDNPNYKINSGYLKTIPYKEAWKSVPPEIIKKIKTIKNYDKEIFEEITGR